MFSGISIKTYNKNHFINFSVTDGRSNINCLVKNHILNGGVHIYFIIISIHTNLIFIFNIFFCDFTYFLNFQPLFFIKITEDS